VQMVLPGPLAHVDPRARTVLLVSLDLMALLGPQARREIRVHLESPGQLGLRDLLVRLGLQVRLVRKAMMGRRVQLARKAVQESLGQRVRKETKDPLASPAPLDPKDLPELMALLVQLVRGVQLV
jgi:hypothetical protein